MRNFNFIYPDQFSTIIFSLFSILMFALVAYVLYRESKKILIIFACYLVVFSIVVQSGIVQQFFIPAGPILFLSILIASVWLAFSKLGLNISNKYSFAFLIGVQSFRFPLEIILHHWAGVGTVPETMTWTGQNFDIISGMVSLISIPFLNKNLKIRWVVQIIGFGLLLNVLRVVLMSSPLPFSWPLENPILLVMYMPYALIGPLFVGVAFVFHLITFRKLLAVT